MKIENYYQVKEGNGLTGKDGQYRFDTEQEAIELAVTFKSDPQKINTGMSDENAEYWKRRDYTVQHVVTIVEDIQTF